MAQMFPLYSFSSSLQKSTSREFVFNWLREKVSLDLFVRKMYIKLKCLLLIAPKKKYLLQTLSILGHYSNQRSQIVIPMNEF